MKTNELLLLREKYLCSKHKKQKSRIQTTLAKVIPLPPKEKKDGSLSKEAPRHFEASQGKGGTFEAMQRWCELGI